MTLIFRQTLVLSTEASRLGLPLTEYVPGPLLL